MGDRYDEPEALGAAARGRAPAGAERAVDVARAADPAGRDQASLLELQRLAGNASVSRLIARDADDEAEGGPSPVLDVVGKGGGSALPTGVRAEMEGRLGADFSDVRVHTDAQASTSAASVGAHAYTVGRDVVFRSDQWSPESTQGKRTLAHELSHVVQQRAGPVAGTETGDGIRLSDPADDFERAAERSADAAMSVVTPSAASASSAPASSVTSAQLESDEAVQRAEPPAAPTEEEEEEDESVQTLAVQRQGEEDEEEEEGSVQTLAVRREAEDEEPEETPAG